VDLLKERYPDTEPDTELVQIQAAGRCVMMGGLMMFLGFYLVVVKILRMTREIETRSLN
jgi:hypothetical protein